MLAILCEWVSPLDTSIISHLAPNCNMEYCTKSTSRGPSYLCIMTARPGEKNKGLFTPCLFLCLVENYHICQACILELDLILDAVAFHISTFVTSHMVGSVLT